ncbi:MAG: hypothetical protein FJ091_14680 [Deltaproteobacteria bacterium]|nr:hypothetical protein [Deltaproteobacteria bacterium]
MSDRPSGPELEDAILAFVRERDWVTFAALHKHFAGDERHETEMVLPGNRVIWAGLTLDVIHAVLALLEQGRLASLPGSKAAYRRDGRVLNLPIERRAEPHDEPQWFPVLLRAMDAVLADEQEQS